MIILSLVLEDDALLVVASPLWVLFVMVHTE